MTDGGPEASSGAARSVERRVAASRRSGLFARIFATFVATFVVTVALVGAATWLSARANSGEWVNEAIELLDEHNDRIASHVDDPTQMMALVIELERPLGTVSSVHDPDGARLAGHGPAALPKRGPRRERQLGRGRPVVVRPEGERPLLLFPVTDAAGKTVAIVHTVEPLRLRQRVLLWVTPALLVAFGLGAWRLSRSLATRIAVLERGVERIAGGELGHRVPIGPKVADELDQLGVAVNEMATRLDRLVGGQRTLLANVSHELRTPLARIKVVLEILRERIEELQRTAGAGARTPLERVERSVADLDEDIQEMEVLVADLLTSGRLDLRASEGGKAHEEAFDLAALLRRVAARVSATTAAPESLTLRGEEFLVERMLSNLLANARRACPDGVVSITAKLDGDTIELLVEDEGPGIAADKREVIFEPFARLDDARSRDRGGAGLGLHLCRQVCAAHGGSIVAVDRADGRRGAAFRVRLPHRPS
jgi:signal transduction histidine kinase